jgi:hypothetical protein
MEDASAGRLRDDLLNEKILSAIVEIKTRLADVGKVLATVREVSGRIDTVVAVGISTRCDAQGEDALLAPLLAELGYAFERAKTNMGLGRITNIEKTETAGDQHAAPVR